MFENITDRELNLLIAFWGLMYINLLSIIPRFIGG